LEELDAEGLNMHAGGCLNIRASVREAIKKQLYSLGHDRTLYNKRRNQNAELSH
jgi:hypothetical protein